MQRSASLILACGLMASLVSPAFAQDDRRAKVLNDKKLIEASGFWIYNDLPKAMREAERTKRPVLAVFRCIPCEACHEFDESVVERDPKIRDLLTQFVCVRIPQTNGLDLSKFQIDFDMSFGVMYLNEDGRLLGRFGTRTGRENEQDDMQLEGFAESMTRALDLHKTLTPDAKWPAAKQGPPSEVATPEQYPSLKGKYTDKLDYEGKVVQSCIHCHQILEAQRLVFRLANEPVPDALLFPWPGLSVIGVTCDPKTASTVATVAPGSVAAKAGLQPGDRLVTMQGQPLVSVADAQWVLQQTGDQGKIDVQVERQGKMVATTLNLPSGWRKASDISWRATSWDLRRMAFGGMLLEPLPDEERASHKLPADKLALRIKHVGEYGEHARAKKAGLLKDDIVIGYDGRSDFRTETDLLAYSMQQKKPGDKVAIEVLRGGERKTMTVQLQ
ncbi:MAG: Trx7/PDZ domain-containing (seleno)protein [Planctomycetaceae bacterium]|nr:Trx7/PDZ domain-containing (seleno)protein [Planctomycetaceae bacterium]